MHNYNTLLGQSTSLLYFALDVPQYLSVTYGVNNNYRQTQNVRCCIVFIDMYDVFSLTRMMCFH